MSETVQTRATPAVAEQAIDTAGQWIVIGTQGGPVSTETKQLGVPPTSPPLNLPPAFTK